MLLGIAGLRTKGPLLAPSSSHCVRSVSSSSVIGRPVGLVGILADGLARGLVGGRTGTVAATHSRLSPLVPATSTTLATVTTASAPAVAGLATTTTTASVLARGSASGAVTALISGGAQRGLHTSTRTAVVGWSSGSGRCGSRVVGVQLQPRLNVRFMTTASEAGSGGGGGGGGSGSVAAKPPTPAKPVSTSTSSVSKSAVSGSSGSAGGASAGAGRSGTSPSAGTNSANTSKSSSSSGGSGGGGGSSGSSGAGGHAAAAPKVVIPPGLVPVRRWLFFNCGLVFSIVILGGYTRLTESGLSMTKWSLAGKPPPRTQAEWEKEFEDYKDSPEYEMVNKGMTIEEFKKIFWFEYCHRMLGRFIGVAFFVPFVYFAARGRLTKPLVRSCTVITLMIGGQGLLGWYMVKSGLKEGFDKNPNEVPRVSQYRLAAHLGSAFVIYLTMLRTALTLTFPVPMKIEHPQLPRLRMLAHLVAGVAFVTAISGAFVAGTRAGLIYDTFPLMGGKIIPDNFLRLEPMWKNFTENTTTIQWDHRVMATITLCLVAGTVAVARQVPLPSRAKLAVGAVAAAVAAQYTLGICTLLFHVPINLAATHQAGSITLLSVALWLVHELRRARIVK